MFAVARALVSSAAVATRRVAIAAAPVEARAFSTSLQSRGLMDRLQSWSTNTQKKKQEEKMQELAKKQLELMQGIESYTLAEHTRVMKWTAESSGIKPTGIQALLRTSEQQKELEEAVLTDVKIGEAVTPAESANPATIQRKEKLRIAATAGTDVSRVNKFLDGYEQSKAVHSWISSRKARGLPVPESMGELFPAMLADKTGLAANKSAGPKPRNLRAAVRSNPN